MTAGKIDIGSMGDFPLLINAARGKQLQPADPARLRHRLQPARRPQHHRHRARVRSCASLADLQRQEGLHERRLRRRRHARTGAAAGRASTRRRASDKLNQQPAVGASALPGGQRGRALAVRRLARAARLPGQGEGAVRRGRAEPADLPRRHRPRGLREAAARRSSRPSCAPRPRPPTTCDDHPVAAAESVAKATGLPARGRLPLQRRRTASPPSTRRSSPQLVAALKKDVPVLKSAKLTGDVDVDSFVDDQYVKQALGSGYAEGASPPTPARRRERGVAQGRRPGPQYLHDARRAAARTSPRTRTGVRAAYVPDATTGTRGSPTRRSGWPTATQLLPFVAPATARAYVAAHARRPGRHVRRGA